MFNLFAEAEGEVRCCRPFFLENMQILAWYFPLVKHNFPHFPGFYHKLQVHCAMTAARLSAAVPTAFHAIQILPQKPSLRNPW